MIKISKLLSTKSGNSSKIVILLVSYDFQLLDNLYFTSTKCSQRPHREVESDNIVLT